LVKRNGNYVFLQTGSLEIGDYLVYDTDGVATDVLVEAMTYFDGEMDVYQVSVDPYDLFIAGDVIVHNKKSGFQGLTNKDIKPTVKL